MKICSKCKIEKHKSEFKKNKRYKTGIESICKDCEHIKDKIYRQTHKKEINEQRRKHYNKDINFKLSCNIKNRIRQVLNGINKSAHTIELIGCDIQNLKYYLQWTAEQNGLINFNIDDYFSEEYEIDHLTPCAIFNFEDPNQQRECFNWRNMQILRAEDNNSKHDQLLYYRK
jgi:hypothetical protein